MMKKCSYSFVLFLISTVLCSTAPAAALKPRVVVLTDISTWETDDHESLIRFLVHADLFEIEGLVISTGYSINTLTKSPEKDFINIAHGVIDAYEKDLPNLMKRSKQVGHAFDGAKQEIGYWPSPKYLRDRTMFGSLNRGKQFLGDDNDSPGSALIIKLADEDDPRPIWVTVWGGGNTVAQSIYRVKKDRTAEQFEAFLRKLRIYTITDQDRNYRGEGLNVSAHGWIREQTGSKLLFIWDESAWKAHNGTGKSNWEQYATHIQGHGHLGSQYPKYKYGVEGDTPSFLYLMPTGLNDPEDPAQCSWGGTFKGDEDNLWQPASSCKSHFDRFYPAAFNNFAARMDWAKDGAGNRNPVIVLEGDNGIGVLTKTPKPGDTITLDASKTSDPDGDNLKFSWWVQADAGAYSGNVNISQSSSSVATVKVPSDSGGTSFHVICEVTDDGTHNLSAYRRIVVQPTGQAAAKPKLASVQPAGKETAETKRSFVNWLKDYIPAQYPGVQVVAHDHGKWFQAKIRDLDLAVSWAELTETSIALKKVEGLREGKSFFVAKGSKESWGDVASVVQYPGAGYYASGYSSATMGDWEVGRLTVVQFDGDSKKFTDEMAKAWNASSATVAHNTTEPIAGVGTSEGKEKPSKSNRQRDGWSRIEAESCDSAEPSGAIRVGGEFLYNIKPNASAQYDKVDLRVGTTNIQMNVANGGGDSAIQVWVGGTKIGTLTVDNTGGWNVYQTRFLALDTPQSGVANVKLLFVNGNVNIDWFSFSASKQPTPKESPKATLNTPTASAPEMGGEPAAGAPYSPHPDKVVVTKVKHFDNLCWKIAAAGGTWYFENGETQGKSGFSSAFDQVGNDWIGNDADRGYNKSPNTGGRHEFRGWPNFGEGNFDHPQRSSGAKTRWVDASGNEIPFADKLQGDHLIMRSYNSKYELEYHFFPTHAAIKVLKAEDKYAFLLEGPIGGEQEASVEKDYYVLKDGKPRECKTGGLGYLEPEFGNTFPSPFFYLVDSDPKDTQLLYVGVKNAGPETAGDEGWRQGLNMVIFSYGRDQDKRAYTGTDAVCVFGFHRKAPHNEVSGFIESRLAAPFEPVASRADSETDARKRLRVIMSSDFPPIGVVKGGNVPNTMKSDPDDMQSMVRFLLYANEFDIEGLIASAGTFAMEAHKKNILGVLDQYEKVYENLRKHDPKYPTSDYLRSVTFEGKGNNHGLSIKWGQGTQPYTDIIGKGRDSEASKAIIAAADKPDPRPIWIGVWGGAARGCPGNLGGKEYA